MSGARFLLLGLLLGGCASTAPVPPAETPFARALLERTVDAPPSLPAASTEPAADVTVPAARNATDEIRGLSGLPEKRLGQLREVADDDAALDGLIRGALDADTLAALAWARSPSVRAARERFGAARTGYAQSQDLGDLVALYRSFARSTDTRVGPERSRAPTAAVATYPGIGALSGEIVRRTVDMAFEDLRAEVRNTVAAARRAHADAIRLAEARAILGRSVRLDEGILEVLVARFEAGSASQAGVLAFRARLERLRTESAVLDEQESVVRARWNGLLSRPADAPLALPTAAAPVPDLPRTVDGDDAQRTALAERQELRRAALAAERSAVAVRLAETMTLPRLDVGSSRLERERAGEAGVQRGAVFPAPGRMVMPRAAFGVREAQVTEMRDRHAAAEAARDALRDRVRTEVRDALFATDAALRRLAVSDESLVPLAVRSLASVRSAYESDRTGYLDLLDAVRRVLDARLARADARRDVSHAHARLIETLGIDPLTRTENE